MLMNAFDKPVQSNTEQAGRGHGFARTFDRVCAFLDERVGGASDFCVEHMASESWPAEQVRAHMEAVVPQLRHWKKRQQES